MVSLRSRQAASASVAGPMPPAPKRSIARNFVRQKATSARTAELDKGKSTTKAVPNGRGKRVKADEETVNAVASDNVQQTSSSPRKRKTPVKKETAAASAAAEEEELPLLSREDVRKATTIDYPRLPFDLSEAMTHLRTTDVRFNGMLDVVELKPYQELVDGRVRELDLFRTLCTSILGQQVSWLAARAIVYRFVRLFHPQLPEKPDFDALPRDALPFPHPIDVCQSDDAFLRTAGLSGAKVKYVKDVARRFSDGRLDARKIITMDEEACIAELVQIKGVGRWTAEMLLMFALRRGNILPVGDLGVQRGMLIFFLSGEGGPNISDKKRRPGVKEEEEENDTDRVADRFHDAAEKVPVVEAHLTESQIEVERQIPNIDNVPDEHETGPHIQAPKNAGRKPGKATKGAVPKLPASVTAALLKSRRDGKKAKGNVYLT